MKLTEKRRGKTILNGTSIFLRLHFSNFLKYLKVGALTGLSVAIIVMVQTRRLREKRYSWLGLRPIPPFLHWPATFRRSAKKGGVPNVLNSRLKGLSLACSDLECCDSGEGGDNKDTRA
jgi:hypothetical protein